MAAVVGARPDQAGRRVVIVSTELRNHLGWDRRHDIMAAMVMAEFALKLPRDRELI